jgi:hypothetical protein
MWWDVAGPSLKFTYLNQLKLEMTPDVKCEMIMARRSLKRENILISYFYINVGR